MSKTVVTWKNTEVQKATTIGMTKGALQINALVISGAEKLVPRETQGLLNSIKRGSRVWSKKGMIMAIVGSNKDYAYTQHDEFHYHFPRPEIRNKMSSFGTGSDKSLDGYWKLRKSGRLMRYKAKFLSIPLEEIAQKQATSIVENAIAKELS